MFDTQKSEDETRLVVSFKDHDNAGMLVFSQHISDEDWAQIIKDYICAVKNYEPLILRGVKKEDVEWVNFRTDET